MSELVDLHARAVAAFGDRLKAVGGDQWHLLTPCADWDVHGLVNHVLNENRWTPPLLAGMTMQEVGDRFDGDLLGEDPMANWKDAAREAVGAVTEEALSRTVHVSFGDISGEEYVSQLTTDHVIHTWDLARGIKTEERLAPDLIDFALEYLGPRAEDWRAAGAFGSKVEVDAGADRQTALLAMTGRRA
ncbi:MAG TPA: TIGR03086 family metal-binding protein [Acidimicrobiales bacterium]|nr:TIGR03086 family metal-binding protein [Acidimicrobiales bacterium]